MEILYHIFTIIGVVLGFTAIALGIISAQNIKNELKDTRVHMVTVTQRSDLLTKFVNIDSYLDNYLIKLAVRFEFVERVNHYRITESGKSTLSDLRVFDYLEDIFYDQPDIATKDLIVRILSENNLSKRVWSFNEKREKRKEPTVPLDAIIATIIVHHESRHE